MGKSNQKGFSLVEVLLVLITLALIVGVGYYIYNNNRSEDGGYSNTELSKTEEEAGSSEDEQTGSEQVDKNIEDPKILEGWVKYSEPDLVYATPAEWSRVEIVRYDSEDDVPFGYGSPAMYTYNPGSKDFSTLTPLVDENGDNIGDMEEPLARASNQQYGNVSGAEATVIFTVGDGPCGRHVIAFVYNGQIYDIRLERWCEEAGVDTIQPTEEEVAASIKQFIAAISLK